MKMKMSRGQGAFEYLMSYGWAVLVVIILGIVLFNLGVFNPNTSATSSGFSVFRPQSWNVVAINASSANLTMAFTNVGGVDLVMQVNGSASGMRLSKPNCASLRDNRNGGCGASQWCARDEQGNQLTTLTGAVVVGAGATIVLDMIAFGNGTSGYTACGGLRGQAYRYRIEFPTATDGYNINHADTGFITGTFQ